VNALTNPITKGSSALYQHAIEIPIPVSLFLLPGQPMDPATFATLLAEHGSEFEQHGHVEIEVPLSSTGSIIHAFEVVTRTSGLMVVEVIAGAASLYGKSIQGGQVAGLLKCNVDMEAEENKPAIMSIDLKSTDDELLEGLVFELEKIQMQ
jgi:AP-3 complex subunit delta-1